VQKKAKEKALQLLLFEKNHATISDIFIVSMVSFFPKNPAFSPKYHQAVVIIQNMAATFFELQNDWNHHDKYRKTAEKIEKDGDEVIHDIITSLNDSFITPFDREDMYMLADRLDDVADNMMRLIIHADIYNIRKTRPYMQEF